MIFNTTVKDIETLNDLVVRVNCQEANFDVHGKLFPVTIGDTIEVNISNSLCKSDYSMTGIVYNMTENETFISCGGMLCRTPNFDKNTTTGMQIYVNFKKQKSKKRKKLS